MQHTPTPAIADSRRTHAGMLSQASLRHQTDERLVLLARSGSERAWTEIMRRYGRQLRAYCARFVGPGRAEDAVQQTFLQAFLALRDGTQREIALRAWLYRIAHNCAIDVLRKGTWEHEQLDLESDGVPQPPTLFEQKEEIRGLVARMQELPAAQRQALALRELEGRSYEEISMQLGHSGSGVRQLIFRARTALRNGVAAILPFEGLRAHQLVSAASVPASSGSGVETAGAAALAVVAVLGGGVAVGGVDAKRARHTPPPAVSTTLGPAAPAAAKRLILPETQPRTVRRHAGSDGRHRLVRAGLPAVVRVPAPAVPPPTGVPAPVPPALPGAAPGTPAPQAPAPAPVTATPVPESGVTQQSSSVTGSSPDATSPSAPGPVAPAPPAKPAAPKPPKQPSKPQPPKKPQPPTTKGGTR